MKIQSYVYSSVILTMLFGTLAYASISSVLAENQEEVANTALSAVKTNDVEVAQPGEIVTYSIVLTNHSGEDVIVSIVDQLPDFVLPIATSPEAQANAENRTITWEQIIIPASQEVVIGLQVQITDNAPHNQIIENTATITGQNVSLSVTDVTRIEATNAITTPAAPISPTAPTGSSNLILSIVIATLLLGAAGAGKLLTSSL